MNLTGRAAIITGANQGLGRAIAEHYVKAGASVLLTARGADLLEQTAAALRPLARAGQQILTLRSDVSQPDDCRAAVELAIDKLPNCCILVNNAGV